MARSCVDRGEVEQDALGVLQRRGIDKAGVHDPVRDRCAVWGRKVLEGDSALLHEGDDG